MLGSAVVAALIGLGASYVTARMTIAANVALESQKVNLQLQQEKARTRIKAFQSLALRLDDLHGAFSAYVVLANIAIHRGSRDKERPELGAQINQIGTLQRNLIDARNDAAIADSPVCKNIDAWLAKFTPGLAQAANDPSSMLKYSGLDADLVNLAAQARRESDNVSIPTP